MSMTKFCSFGFAAVCVLITACGGDDSKPKEKCPTGFVVGQMQVCACGDAAMGTQTCMDDGNLGDCVCGGAGSTAGMTGATAGMTGTTAGAGVPVGGTTAGGGTSGTGATDEDSGVGSTAGTGAGSGGNTDGGTSNPTQPAQDGTKLSACDPMAMTPCDKDLSCYTGGGATSVGFCTPSCTMDTDCTSLGKDFTCSTATVGPGGAAQYCRQVCTGTDDKSCPEFMSCQAVTGGFRCLYDEKDVGTASKKQWQECAVTGDCTGDLICYTSALLAPGGYSGFCTQQCTQNSDCDAPKTGDATADCDTNVGQCRLNCAGTGGLGAADKSCPDGMECANLTGGGPGGFQIKRCVYAGSGTGGI